MCLLACMCGKPAEAVCKGRGHGAYCSTDMMTDEDKEATIKNGRGPRCDEAHVDACNAETAQWRQKREGMSPP